jgi:hypothetical protein
VCLFRQADDSHLDDEGDSGVLKHAAVQMTLKGMGRAARMVTKLSKRLVNNFSGGDRSGEIGTTTTTM